MRGGYSLCGVEPDRVYTLSEAAQIMGTTYEDLWTAKERGALHVVASTWNDKRLYVRGSELRRVMREEFVAV